MEEDMLGAALVVRFGFDLQSIVRVDEDDGTPCHSRQRHVPPTAFSERLAVLEIPRR